MEQKALFDGEIRLAKFSGKGAWTYAPLPPLPIPGRNAFGLAKVTGSIDAYELPLSNLMPMGNGRSFLPVKAEVRKIIGKQAGDTVRLVLYAEAQPLAVSDEDLLACLADAPAAEATYARLSPPEQTAWLNWVRAAPTDDAKVARMVAALARLEAGVASPPSK
ncbi:YdeI/OmpD-associated family protein [Hymenobacter oligotrophus]|uniref:YdeI/OmpD-associated family protein n=1 Tax=Hymenobacter oligotrophus TaxID=2319843 RepID=UPI001F09C60D|nr:YdeI/OmpD-associated family protein [Hymenobacter oligotrophus]